MSLTEPVTPLWLNRDYRRLWVGHALSDVGSRATDLALPLLVLAVTGSPFEAGAVGSVRLAAFVAFALPGGALADRCDRRRGMLVAEAVRAIAVGLLACAVWVGWESLAWLVVLAIVDAAGMAVTGPAHVAALRQIVPQPQLAVAGAREEARGYAAELAGPPCGGALFGVAMWAPFLADALSYLASFVAIARIRTPLRAAPRDLSEPKASIGRAFGFAWRQPFLRVVLLIAPISNMAITGVLFVLIVVLKQRGLTSVGIGAVQTAIMVGGLIGALAAPWLLARVRPGIIIVGSCWVAVTLIAALGLLPGTYVLAVPLLLLMLCAPAENATFFSYQVSLTPDHLQGRVQGICGMLSQLASPLGPLLGGLLVEREGGSRTFLVFAAILVVSAIVATGSRVVRESRLNGGSVS
jgi:MFS family permease